MKAVVLTAGIARRMQPLSDHLHKTLLPIGESTILGRIVDGLLALGVRDLTLVTGHRAQDLKTFMAERYPDLAVNYVHNPRYAETNNIVSLSLALDTMVLDDDLLLIESDLLFDPAVLPALLLPGGENLALVDRYRPGMDGTVVSASDGMIDGVFPPHLQGEGFTYGDKFKTLNIYRFNKDFVRARFQPLLSCYANLIDQNCYYELVLGMLVNMQRERIRAVLVDAPWAEVDDPNDFASARFTFEPQQRTQLLERAAGGHWGLDLLDFHFIRNMHFPTDAMIAALRQALPGLVRSYGSSQSVLDEKLSFHLRCAPERVAALHGASQIYPWLPELLGTGPVLAPWPTFGEYKRIFPEHVRYDDLPGIDLEQLEAGVSTARTIVIVNPNNPTGTTLSTAWIHALAARHPERRFVVDESFIDFSSEEPLVARLERAPLPNVLVLKSLSKTLGVPGLRLGYAYSSDAVLMERIRAHIPIWNLSAPSEFFLELLLKFRPELERSFAQTAADRDDLSTRLRELPQVERVFPSGGDYLLAKLRGDDPAQGKRLVDALLARFRIYAKDVSPRFAAQGVWLRLAVRLPHQHQRLGIDALRAVLTWNLLTGARGCPTAAPPTRYAGPWRFLMRIGVPKETAPRETRVALIPETAKKLVAKKHEVVVESGAGKASGASDDDYIKAGARIAPTADALFAEVEVVLKLQAPDAAEMARLKSGQTLVSFLYPLSNPKLLESLCARGVNALAVDSIPRTTLAQMMDVLSSQATLAGYRAVILAAEALPKLFPMLMTAAGTIAPAKTLVLGAGVAGLQAIATARRLGANVEVFDVRRVVKEQVESLGARFVEVEGAEDAQGAGGYAKEVSEETKVKQAALVLDRISKTDVVITTALIPGKRAPVLVTAEMVKAMRPQTVIVDIAAEQGGNCALTKPGERFVTDNGVTIVGELNLPAQMAVHASQMWSRNMEKLLLHLVGKEGTDLKLDATDEITRGVVTIRSGKVVDPRLAPKEAKS